MIDLISVNVGEITAIGLRRGKPVLSGYRKQPVQTDTVEVGPVGIAGDHQGDLRVHGGPEKAIYAYSSDHFPFWNEAMQPATPFGPGSFAENLTLRGIDETGICIGDIWEWGTATIQVCQPRFPCFKMALATDRPQIVKRFLAEGRSGVYFRVLKPGTAPVGGPVDVITVDLDAISVREAALALSQGTDSVRMRAIAVHPALARSWSEMLLESADYLEQRLA